MVSNVTSINVPSSDSVINVAKLPVTFGSVCGITPSKKISLLASYSSCSARHSS